VSQNATTTIGRIDSGETVLNYTAPVDYNIMAQNGTFQNGLLLFKGSQLSHY
jgi:hypothetical protein